MFTGFQVLTGFGLLSFSQGLRQHTSAFRLPASLWGLRLRGLQEGLGFRGSSRVACQRVRVIRVYGWVLQVHVLT